MSDTNSGGMTAVVAIVGIVVILGVGYVVMQNFMDREPSANPVIDVNIPDGDAE